ncbi:hypothetical protein AAG570_007643 [Ranatra chinensis]|uniref:Uncharacterized protein n=1 Tax=Ranatra chinensis TaxID=642074 RepID=A0ABD0XU89_9HEMI
MRRPQALALWAALALCLAATPVRHGRSRLLNGARWARHAAHAEDGRRRDPPSPPPPPTTRPPPPAPHRPDLRGDVVTKFLRIVESQHLLGDNCTAGTDLNLGEGVVDRYAQVRYSGPTHLPNYFSGAQNINIFSLYFLNKQETSTVLPIVFRREEGFRYLSPTPLIHSHITFGVVTVIIRISL